MNKIVHDITEFVLDSWLPLGVFALIVLAYICD